MSYGRDYRVKHCPKLELPWQVLSGELGQGPGGDFVIIDNFCSEHKTKEQAIKEAKRLIKNDPYANGTLEIENSLC